MAFNPADASFVLHEPELKHTTGYKTVTFTEFNNSLWPSAFYYDTRGRLIQERSLNHHKGIEINSMTYSGLTDKVVTSEHKHSTLINGINYAQTEKYIFSYDAEKRLTSRNYYLQNQLVNRIVLTYNSMGDQVIKKEYFEGGTLRQTVDFQYNIKGWLTKINNPDVFVGSGDYFAMQLLYNQKLHDSINCLPRYNGNISFIRWQTKKPDWSSDNELAGEKGYAFNYDNLNRLSGNTYYEHISGKLVKSNAYQEVINDYDKNGNIKGLKRQAKNYSPITIDNLTYTYTGNQLIAVDDAIAKSYDYDFFDNGHYYYITRTPEFLYDANGNLTQDLNKEIVNITYNELNLPKIIDFKNNSRIEYQYDALGVKKRQLVTEGGKLVKTTDFIGNFVYENNYPVYNSFDEGRIIYGANGTYFAETYIKDHLGNIRVAYGNELSGDTQQYGIRQVNAYYPFGMNINPLTANKISKYKRNEFLYNGKMFQDELGLNWLDYGARFYDPALGRWHTVDPLSEQYRRWSPYNYCVNNPLRFIDPDGMWVTDIWNIRTHKKTHIPDGKNDQKIDLGKGNLIDAPNLNTVSTYEQMFTNGESSGKEQLIVSSDNGINSKIVEGKNGNHLGPEDFKAARVDLVSKGETPTSDTHYHPNEKDENGNYTTIGLATPSDTDKDPKNNIGNTKACVVLGYYDGSIPDKSLTNGTPPPLKPVRAIGFYDTSGPIGSERGYNFSNFVKLVNKIHNQDEKH